MDIVGFITVLAWVFGVLATTRTLLQMLGKHYYTEFEKIRDQIQGVERVFPFMLSGSIAIVCWAWIVSQW